MNHNAIKTSEKNSAVVWPETRRGQVTEATNALAHDQDGAFDGPIIDRALLEMLEALPKGLDMPSRVALFEQQTGSKIRALQIALGECNREVIEELAGEISRQAITVGAVKILRLCYELQAMARCAAYEDAGRTAEELEIAFIRAQESLRTAV